MLVANLERARTHADVLRRRLDHEIRTKVNHEWELANAHRIYRGIIEQELTLRRGIIAELNKKVEECNELRARLGIHSVEHDQADELELAAGTSTRGERPFVGHGYQPY